MSLGMEFGSNPDLRTRARTVASELDRNVRGLDAPLLADEHHLDEAINWLYESQDATGVGGSAATYNLVLGWEDAFPETTGYIIPTLYNHANHASASESRERVESMAEWLLTLQNDDGSFPGYDTLGRGGGPMVFDTGQIVFGLLRAAMETDDDRYREATAAACDWLVDQQTNDGYWARHTYKGQRHTYTVRVAWALLQAAEALNETRYRDAAVANFGWTTTQQRTNGWFDNCGFSDNDNPFLHTIAYTVRGLLEAGIELGEKSFLETARTTADRLLLMQVREGVLMGEYNFQWEPASYYCLTGNAQMALVWYRLYQQSGDEKYRIAARQTLDFLKEKQRLKGPPCVRGAMPGSYPIWGRYMYLRYPNWATKFFIDALHLAAEVEQS